VQDVVREIASALRLDVNIVSARLSLLLQQVDLASGTGGAAAAAASAGAAGAEREAPFVRVYSRFAAARSGACSWEAAARELIRATASEVVVNDSDRSHYHDLDSAVDSFRTLYCRRCHVFDCHLHGCGQLLPETRRAAVTLEPDAAPSRCGACCALTSSDEGAAEQLAWTTMEQSLFTTACKIHGRNSCRIARVISTRTCAEVRAAVFASPAAEPRGALRAADSCSGSPC
jgi:hypothetical protein